MKLVLLGKGRAGKTSLLGALTGRRFQDEEPSTVYMHVDEVESVDQREVESWQAAVSSPQLMKSASQHLNRMRREDEQAKEKSQPVVAAGSPSSHTAKPAAASATSSAPSSKSFSPTKVAGDGVAEFAAAHVSRTNKSGLLQFLSRPSIDKNIVKELSEFQQNTKAAQATISAFDFAGQDRYTVFQSLFVTPQTVYLLVLDLSSFADPAQAQKAEQDVANILGWLSTVWLRAGGSPVFLIGTRADTLGDAQAQEAVRQKLIVDLERRIPLPLLEQIVLPKASTSAAGGGGGGSGGNGGGVRGGGVGGGPSFLFFTSSKTRQGIESLRSEIDHSIESYLAAQAEKPIDWIRLQDHLVQLAKSPARPLVLSFDELYSLANKSFHISSPEELRAVLVYFCQIGVVMYFPANDELRNVVFISPQAVVSIVARIFHWTDSPPSEQQVAPECRAAVRELREHGVWQKSLLFEAWRDSINAAHLPSLVALLKEYDLLCDWKRLDGSIISIVPCLLADKPISRDWMDSNSSCANLVITFPHDILPTGLFHHLSVRLSSLCPETFFPEVYRHCALLSCGDVEFVVTEDAAHHCIRIAVKLRDGRQRSDFAHAWLHLAGLTTAVISEHWSKAFGFKLKPECPLLSPQRHALPNIPRFGSSLPAALRCGCHKDGIADVPLESLKEWWFQPKTADASGPKQTKLRVMLSYSWGPVDEKKSYPNQEMRGDMVEQMTSAISNADAVVACVNPTYCIKNSNAYKEFCFAIENEKIVVGVRLTPDTDMTAGAYGFHLGKRQKYYDVSDGVKGKKFDSTIDELVRDLQSLVLARKSEISED